MRKGSTYENIATEYLRSKGYTILARNYHCGTGEIDIIALEGDVLVFVEVKGAKNKTYGHPAERFSEEKLNRILSCAYRFMEEHSYECTFRIDLITVEGKKIGHFKNLGFF